MKICYIIKLSYLIWNRIITKALDMSTITVIKTRWIMMKLKRMKRKKIFMWWITITNNRRESRRAQGLQRCSLRNKARNIKFELLIRRYFHLISNTFYKINICFFRNQYFFLLKISSLTLLFSTWSLVRQIKIISYFSS